MKFISPIKLNLKSKRNSLKSTEIEIKEDLSQRDYLFQQVKRNMLCSLPDKFNDKESETSSTLSSNIYVNPVLYENFKNFNSKLRKQKIDRSKATAIKNRYLSTSYIDPESVPAKKFLLLRNQKKRTSLKKRCVSQGDLGKENYNMINILSEEEREERKKKKMNLLKRSGRIEVLKNMKEFLNSNGLTLKFFREENPIKVEPYKRNLAEEFFEAVKNNKIAVVEHTLQDNPELLFEHDFMNQTVFHWAAKFGYAKLIEVMLKYGKCCNLFDYRRRTPLYFAAASNSLDCVNVLLKHGANPNLLDLSGKRPYDVTTDWEIRKALEAKSHELQIYDKFQEIFRKIKNAKGNNNSFLKKL